jgi:hypothetical protein
MTGWWSWSWTPAIAGRSTVSVLAGGSEQLSAYIALAYYTGMAGDAAAARDQVGALVPVSERVLGAEHPTTLIDRANLAYWTGMAGDAAGARDQFAALLPVYERVSGAEHPDTLAARVNLAYWTKRAQNPE